VIFYLLKNPTDTELRRILKLRTKDPELKRKAIDLIQESGAFTAGMDEMTQLHREISALVDSMGPNPAFSELLSALINLY
jgi:hypothetical protein